MFDVIVIGGGPAGVTAALRARELGAMVALVERGKMGGTCTNDGCVPTRALARAARLVRDAEQFVDFGLVGEKPMVDFAALLSRTRPCAPAFLPGQRVRANAQRCLVLAATAASGSGGGWRCDGLPVILVLLSVWRICARPGSRAPTAGRRGRSSVRRHLRGIPAARHRSHHEHRRYRADRAAEWISALDLSVRRRGSPAHN
ncbi:MAG: NAD(P)/FAD-dependent oxidoreductase [Chloroflexi bacterium]|nr:MAG: NAD(P)/FAD-dependent oxidoreductase [Chloroflexota bacterium]